MHNPIRSYSASVELIDRARLKVKSIKVEAADLDFATISGMADSPVLSVLDTKIVMGIIGAKSRSELIVQCGGGVNWCSLVSLSLCLLPQICRAPPSGRFLNLLALSIAKRLF